MSGELKHTKVIPIFTEGTRESSYQDGKWYISEDYLIGNGIAVQDVIKVSTQLKGNPNRERDFWRFGWPRRLNPAVIATHLALREVEKRRGVSRRILAICFPGGIV